MQQQDPNAQKASDNVSIGTDEIENRFGYHRPTPENASAHIDLRLRFRRMAEDLDAVLPHGRAKSLAFTALQEASMWSQFAIAETAPVVRD